MPFPTFRISNISVKRTGKTWAQRSRPLLGAASILAFPAFLFFCLIMEPGEFPSARYYPLGDGVTCEVVTDGFGPWVNSCTKGAGADKHETFGPSIRKTQWAPDGSVALVEQFVRDAKQQGYSIDEHGWKHIGYFAHLRESYFP